MGYWLKSEPGSLRSTELLTGLERAQVTLASIGQPHEATTVEWPRHAYALLVSQDCDLDWHQTATQEIAKLADPPLRGQARIDWNEASSRAHAKLMTMALLCHGDLAEVVQRQSGLKSQQWKMARENQNERYHVLRPLPSEDDATGDGLGEIVLDFKRHFAVPVDELAARCALPHGAVGAATRRAFLDNPYREEVLVRFYAYQMRVATPEAGPTALALPADH